MKQEIKLTTMPTTIPYKALVHIKRQANGKPIYLHIVVSPDLRAEFAHNGKPNLFPPETTMQGIAEVYDAVATEEFIRKFYDWHELIDCQLVIQDSIT